MGGTPQFPLEQTADGEFQRQADRFRQWVTADGTSGYPAAKNRYHLYVSWACPWAHRTIIVRKLKGLEDSIGLTAVDPIRDERGWAFRDGPGHSIDPVNGFHYLADAYRATDPSYHARVTVPVLWDRVTRRIVSNSDDDLMRMFNSEFNQFARTDTDFYPAELRDDIDRLNDRIYDDVNNGVYRAGFAISQRAYERAVRRLFDTIDILDHRLSDRR
jgi:putative glutathione S-transferase